MDHLRQTIGDTGLGHTIAQIEPSLENRITESAVAIQTSLSRGFAVTESLFQAGQKSLDMKLENIHQANRANKPSRLFPGIRRTDPMVLRRLASMDAKLASLAISKEEGTARYNIFAGHNVEDILLPLMMMRSHLVPVISELIKCKRITVKQDTLDDIYTQFKEFLASCHDASAVSIRRQNKVGSRKAASSSQSLQSMSPLQKWSA